MQHITAMTRVHRASSRRWATAGISIIEVLVAIAILTIGMLAILILFPAGLVTLQTAANSTNADRLAQEELEKANASELQLIGQVYPNDDLTASVNPATFFQNSGSQISNTGHYTTGNGPSLTNGSDVDAFRSIKGETIRVPSLNSANISLYTVVASPIESGTLKISGTPWAGISGNCAANSSGTGASTDSNYSDPGAILMPGQPEYLIDYANGYICLSPEASGASYTEPIIFTVTDANGKTTTQYLLAPSPGQTGSVNLGQPGTWTTLSHFTALNPDGTTSTSPVQLPPTPWVRGSDVLVRNFQDVTGTQGYMSTNFSTNGDPFQYQIYTPDFVAATPTAATPSANLGVIAFNPAACNMRGPNGQPLKAVLNYRTYDWHIISEDRSINSNNGTIRLALINILASTAKDVLSDNTTPFTGLFTYSKSITPSPDVIVLDMDTGKQLNPRTDYTVNYSSGSISFANTNGQYANDHLRIYYHPANDWAVALSRAPNVYNMDSAPADVQNNTPALSSYVAPISTSPSPVPGTTAVQGTKIYFPLVDVNKQVDIRFQYVTAGAAASTPPSTIESLYTISSNGSLAFVDLADTTTQTNTILSSSTILNPLVIKGASLSAVVIWKENDIWHNRTISTLLPPAVQVSPTNTQ